MADDNPIIAIILSIIGGILILINGIIILAVGTFFLPFGAAAYAASIVIAVGVWGIICGIIILFGSYVLYNRPVRNHVLWGVIIIIFSILSFFAGGGFIIGAILGIIGGAVAIAWNPPRPPAVVVTPVPPVVPPEVPPKVPPEE
ncbi:MAG TPA: DUF6114 domain-containing protein [Methanomicrobiales archaeon]|nr:DUF6114 domain-containing protein [Methanomicrobiales archaeon]